MKPIGVIFNPFAYRNKRQTETQINALKELLGKRGQICVTKSKDEIPKALKEVLKDVEIVAISGGDGTISSVISSFINLFGEKNLPMIAPLKGGTINMIADDARLRDDQITICRTLIRYIEDGYELPSIERGLIRVIDNRFDFNNYAFTWIDGFLHKFIKLYRAEGANVGVALKLILKSGIMSLANPRHDLFEEVESKIFLDGQELPFDSHLFIAAATVKRLVFGFRLFAEEAKAGEEFGFYCMSQAFFRKALFQLPRYLYLGVNSDASGNFINRSAKSLKIKGNRGYVIDGEVYDTEAPTDLTLEAGPRVKIFSLKGKK